MLNDQGKKADDISDLSCKTLFVSQKEPVGCSLLHTVAVFQCSHATLLPTILSSRLCRGALRDNTKNSCAAD